MKQCSIIGCSNKFKGLAYCQKHLTRYRKYGDTHYTKYQEANRYYILHIAEYRAWATMKNRCYNYSHKDYSNYGGRGIKVCDEWLSSFRTFYTDMGERPGRLYSLDRINNEGNYESSNCQWATRKQQANNRRPRKRNF